MKIGYPCINQSIGKKTISTFRLSSFSKERLIQSVTYNLQILVEILKYNIQNDLLFFRISSDIIPFASHPICKFDWMKYFKYDFIKIGQIIKKNNIRISMHPDQFVLLNAHDPKIVHNSINELEYHADVLDLMKLDYSAKIQIHIGGVYKNKEQSIRNFITNYENLLLDKVKKRLVIENDDYRFSLQDCIFINEHTKTPILLDIFHHECLNNNLTLIDAMHKIIQTWYKPMDGIPMIDYSNQEPNQRKGKHALTIDLKHFKNFISLISSFDHDLDIMLELKDKEKSADKAVKMLNQIKSNIAKE